jgi:anion-transporting  ArsA/GET3 family ATPase
VGGHVTLDELAAQRAVIVCCGPGGVGKTTVSATIALQAARIGRRACVVTVDPARRLADALGVEALVNSPRRVEGPWPGELEAVMLDTQGTFDELIERYAQDEAQAASIKGNRIYKNLSASLSGTQEYMAMEKLYELTQEHRYDVVVVDTPPTRNALDLLDAPRRLTHFLENRIFRALLAPTRAYLRAMTIATHAVLRTLSRVAGAEIVDDAVTFFQAFQGMEEGFRTRASAVRALLADPQTAYAVVTSPRPDAVTEALYFVGKLAEAGLSPSAVILNRVHPSFGPCPDLLGTLAADSPIRQIAENLAALETIAHREDAACAALVARTSPAPVGRVELLGSDVHDVSGLTAVADQLFCAPPVTP